MAITRTSMSASTITSKRLSSPIDCHKHGTPHSHPDVCHELVHAGMIRNTFLGCCHYEPMTPHPLLRFPSVVTRRLHSKPPLPRSMSVMAISRQLGTVRA